MTYFIKAIFKQKLLFKDTIAYLHDTSKYDDVIRFLPVTETLLKQKLQSIKVVQYPRKV